MSRCCTTAELEAEVWFPEMSKSCRCRESQWRRGVLCKEIPHSEIPGSHCLDKLTGIWQWKRKKKKCLGPKAKMNFIRCDGENEWMWNLVQMEKVNLIWKKFIEPYSTLTCENQHTLYPPESILWYFTSSFFWASLAALYATAAQWLHWIKPTMALLGEGCNFLVMCVLCWCAGYEGTHRDSISLCVMQSLLRKVEIASRFSIIKVVHESLRIDSNFQGVAENKRMFAVMVNLQTGEGKLMEWGIKLNPFGLLTSQRRFSSAS